MNGRPYGCNSKYDERRLGRGQSDRIHTVLSYTTSRCRHCHTLHFKPAKCIFESLSRGEILLYFPYHSYDYVVRFFEEAASDPAVTAISATLYRVARKSKIAKALEKAAKMGKFVTVLVELKARFNERVEHKLGSETGKKGENVIYGVPNYKVHGKLALVTRMEDGNSVDLCLFEHREFQRKHCNALHRLWFFYKGRPDSKRDGPGFSVFPQPNSLAANPASDDCAFHTPR